MKHKHNPSYRSYLATMKRKRSEAFFDLIKRLYAESLGSKTLGKYSTCAILDEVL